MSLINNKLNLNTKYTDFQSQIYFLPLISSNSF